MTEILKYGKMKRKYSGVKMFFKKLIFLLYKNYIQLKWKIFWRYYAGLAVQARFLYQQSPLFKYRWQEMGLDFARESFDNTPSDGEYFFWKARKEPFKIRWQIFLDAITEKKAKAILFRR